MLERRGETEKGQNDGRRRRREKRLISWRRGGRGGERPRVRKGTSDPQSSGERRLCVGRFCVGEQPC